MEKLRSGESQAPDENSDGGEGSKESASGGVGTNTRGPPQSLLGQYAAFVCTPQLEPLSVTLAYGLLKPHYSGLFGSLFRVLS